jgi:hypothetical protein
MSRVTNVMLAVMSDDKPCAEEFNRWLDEDCPRLDPRVEWTGCGELILISETTRWGGTKAPECTVYAGTLNHAYLPAVVERFGQVPWHYPNAVQLLLQGQEEFYFRLWMIRDGKPQQYGPTSPHEDDNEFLG